MISAQVIADSINEAEDRVTTMIVTMPRYILAEFNTHRAFSRNSASSRAIPFEKMLRSVQDNPFIPIAWQKDHKGMQGKEYLTKDEDIYFARVTWLDAMYKAVQNAKSLNSLTKVTKQLCNRLLEPFMWHTVIVTATDWINFFDQRCPKYEASTELYDKQQFRSKRKLMDAIHEADIPMFEKLNTVDWLRINKGEADIHMMAVAEAMIDALHESKPRKLPVGGWHIPFENEIPAFEVHNLAKARKTEFYDVLLRVATARCARVSYTVVGEEREIDIERDLELANKLILYGHWSPFEHCAKNEVVRDHLVSNLKGFVQYRKLFPEENKDNRKSK